MRAFKKIMSAAIATAIAAAMATSAFAAKYDAGKVTFVKTTDTEGNVTAYDYDAAGQTTVLVVPADVWTGTAIADGLEDSDILYINQYEDADEANDAIIAGFGVKVDAETGTLADGDYVALFGGTVEDKFTITPVAFSVSSTPDEPEKKVLVGDVNGTGVVDVADLDGLALYLLGLNTFEYEYVSDKPDGTHVVE